MESAPLPSKLRAAAGHLVIALVAAQLAAPARAAAQPPPQGIEQSVRPPQLTQRIDATYPPAALAARREADVTLEVTVDASGHVERSEGGRVGWNGFRRRVAGGGQPMASSPPPRRAGSPSPPEFESRLRFAYLLRRRHGSSPPSPQGVRRRLRRSKPPAAPPPGETQSEGPSAKEEELEATVRGPGAAEEPRNLRL